MINSNSDFRNDYAVLKYDDKETYKHRILYYGPEKIDLIASNLHTHHTNNTDLLDIPDGLKYEELPLDNPTVFVVDYDMQQAEILLLAKGGLLNISDIRPFFIKKLCKK